MRFAIACGHERTASAAAEILRNGGNAIDAAISAFTTSWIAEPCMSGPGGGAFITILLNGKPYCIDAFANTPKVKRPRNEIDLTPVEVDFGSAIDIFYAGMGSIAVPGAIKGIFNLHQLGGSIPIPELFVHAIESAKTGIIVNDFQALDIQLLQQILGLSSRGRELFYPDEKLIKSGDLLKFPFLADFMDYLSREGPDAFYQGEVAHKIEAASREFGGHLSKEDLRFYSTRFGITKSTILRDFQVLTQDWPSIGAYIQRRMLDLFSTQSDHSADRLLEALIEIHQMKEKGHFGIERFLTGGIKKGGTSHISIVDKDNNAVSLSMSIGEGSGFFVEGTDIHMNNMLGEESLLPDRVQSWTPDQRMASMMSPSIIINKARNLIASLGSGGASRIPLMIGQVIYHLVYGNLGLQKSVEHPRIHLNADKWEVEPGFQKSKSTLQYPWNQWDNTSLYFGGVHCASKIETDFYAYGDSRRHGVSMVK